MNDILVAMLELAYNKDLELPSFKTIAFSEDELAMFEGTFSAPAFPLKITVKSIEGQLTAQATGKGAFPLTATSKTDFEFSAAGIKMRFIKLNNGRYQEFEFSQGGQGFTFARDN